MRLRAFRAVWAPTKAIGHVVAWLAEGYRAGTPIERMLIWPSWAVLRGLFLVGWKITNMLHVPA